MYTSTEQPLFSQLEWEFTDKSREKARITHGAKKQKSLEKWLIAGLGQQIYKMSQEHLLLSESKKVLKTNRKQNTKPKKTIP